MQGLTPCPLFGPVSECTTDGVFAANSWVIRHCNPALRCRRITRFHRNRLDGWQLVAADPPANLGLPCGASAALLGNGAFARAALFNFLRPQFDGHPLSPACGPCPVAGLFFHRQIGAVREPKTKSASCLLRAVSSFQRERRPVPGLPSMGFNI